MENNTVTIPEREYESLIRDSEKVRILTQAALDGVDPGYWLGVILGVQQPEPGTLSPEEEKQLEALPLRGKNRGGSKKKIRPWQDPGAAQCWLDTESHCGRDRVQRRIRIYDLKGGKGEIS